MFEWMLKYTFETSFELRLNSASPSEIHHPLVFTLSDFDTFYFAWMEEVEEKTKIKEIKRFDAWMSFPRLATVRFKISMSTATPLSIGVVHRNFTHSNSSCLLSVSHVWI